MTLAEKVETLKDMVTSDPPVAEKLSIVAGLHKDPYKSLVRAKDTIFIRLELPLPIVESYEKEAKDTDSYLEKILTERLIEAKDHNASKPIYINDAHRKNIEGLLGANIDSPYKLEALLRNVTTFKVAGVDIQLTPQIINRLKSRSLHHEFNEFLSNLVIRHLEEYVGLR